MGERTVLTERLSRKDQCNELIEDETRYQREEVYHTENE